MILIYLIICELILIQSKGPYIKSYFKQMGEYRLYLPSIYKSEISINYIPILLEINATYLNYYSRYENTATIEESNITYNSIEYERYIINDKIKYTAIDDEFDTLDLVVPLTFYDFRKPPSPYRFHFGLSFAYSFQNYSFSLVHQFTRLKYIKHNKFTFKPNPNLKEGSFYIGDCPDDIIQKKVKGECKVRNKKWGCNLSQIYFTNMNNNANTIFYSFTNQYEANFDSAYEYIYAPKEYLEYIIQTLFRDAFKDGICEYVTHSILNCIECKIDSNIDEYLPYYANIIFDDYVYTLNTSMLYSKAMDGIMRFNIVDGTDDDKKNKWTFGTKFLENFISSFDYDEHKITFYSDRYIEKINDKEMYTNKKGNKVNMIICILIFILIIGSLFNLSHKLSNKLSLLY